MPKVPIRNHCMGTHVSMVPNQQDGDMSCEYGGDELMEIGLILQKNSFCSKGDFSSVLIESIC